MNMTIDFPIGEQIYRIAEIAAALRELDSDLPMAEALEAQVTMLEGSLGRYCGSAEATTLATPYCKN
jgi:hypothetical protein